MLAIVFKKAIGKAQAERGATYDRAASLATMSDNEIDSCLGLVRDEVLDCPGLLLRTPPS